MPYRRVDDFKIMDKIVGPSSTIQVQHNTYSLHSRLIGENVRIKLCLDYFEVWHGQNMVECIPRLRGEDKYRIQYRHIIDWLVRKPGAFENYRYKPEMFPSSCFRRAYDCLKVQNPLRANKEYLKILHTASKEGEALIENILRRLLSENKPISALEVNQITAQGQTLPMPADVTVDTVTLEAYDELLEAVYG